MTSKDPNGNARKTNDGKALAIHGDGRAHARQADGHVVLTVAREGAMVSLRLWPGAALKLASAILDDARRAALAGGKAGRGEVA